MSLETVRQNVIDCTKCELCKTRTHSVPGKGNFNSDVIFVGGTGGDTKEIVELSQNKLKSGGRIVIGIILIETLYSVLKTIENLKFDSVDITQITIGKSRKTSTGTMMLARNPVTIISSTKT